MFKYTEAELTKIVYDAMQCFNERMNFNILPNNTVLAFFTPDNGIEVYEAFCSKYFPDWLQEDYMADGYFEDIAASAFIGEQYYGMLIRLDLEFPETELFQIFIHEISHIYCTVNEIDGGYFFDKYCHCDDVTEDGIMNAGYAIWREAIADIMAQRVNPYGGYYTLKYVKLYVNEMYRHLSYINPESKKAMSLIIAYLMVSDEIVKAKDWNKAEAKIRRVISFDNEMIFRILKLVYINLSNESYWKITPDFIYELGEKYLLLIANKTLE